MHGHTPFLVVVWDIQLIRRPGTAHNCFFSFNHRRISQRPLSTLLGVQKKTRRLLSRDAPLHLRRSTYPTCRSSALVIWSFGTAPTICSTTCPFLNTSSVGIPCTRYRPAEFMASSTFNFITLSLPA